MICAACTQNAEATKAEKLWDGEKVQLSADGQSIEAEPRFNRVVLQL